MANGEHRPTRTSRAVAQMPSAEGALSGDEHDSTETSSAVVGSAATRHDNGRIGETLTPSNVPNHPAATRDCPFENARLRRSGAFFCSAAIRAGQKFRGVYNKVDVSTRFARSWALSAVVIFTRSSWDRFGPKTIRSIIV